MFFCSTNRFWILIFGIGSASQTVAKNLVHYTTTEGAIGIEKLGKAFLGDIYSKNIPIEITKTNSYLRVLPNLIYIDRLNLQLPTMVGTINGINGLIH